MGWCLHNQLADTRVHFEDWAATVKELISTESNGLASQGAYFKMHNLKVHTPWRERLHLISPAAGLQREPRDSIQQRGGEDGA